MTPSGSLFFDEWQACLRAHYVHVIRTQDTITEPTLRSVLLATGLSEDELAALREDALAEAGLVEEAAALSLPAAPPDEDTLPEEVTLEAAALEDELELVAPADLGTDLAPVPADAPDSELPPNDPDEDSAIDDDPEPYTPAPGQLSLF